MNLIDLAAREFRMKPDELVNQSMKAFLNRKLVNIESEIFLLVKKYGIKDVFEMDAKIQEGLIREEESYDDYFALDNLEAEREKVKSILDKLT